MHACRQKAASPDRVRTAGTLPSRGASPKRANFSLDTKCLHCAPLNGRAFAYVRQPLSMSVRARDFRVCARRFESVRRIKTFANAMTVLFEVLLQVMRPRIENVRSSCTHWGLVPRLWSVPAARTIAGVVAYLVCTCAVLYGFMKCKADCVSSLICVSYLENNFSNCPVSWRKPVGVAGVRTNDSCPMVRKDTNSKMR